MNPVSTCSERVLWAIDELGQEACAAISVDSPDTFLLKRGIVAYGRAQDD